MQMVTKTKLLGIVVTYYPDIDETRNNIMQYIADVDCLIIWENTPEADLKKHRILLSQYADKIIYMGTGKNEYIAYPLNRAVEYGQQNGFTHILTMDQDSCFENGHFEKFKQIACENQDSLSIFGSNPNYRTEFNDDLPIQQETLITSGNVINLKLFDTIGLYREDYKIDCVDYEFCYRANRKGFHCFMIGSILLKQKFGNTVKTKMSFFTSNYPPMRLYFMARNNILLYREYPEYGFGKIKTYIIKPFFKIILSEKKKMTKIKSLFRGFIDGVKTKNTH